MNGGTMYFRTGNFRIGSIETRRKMASVVRGAAALICTGTMSLSANLAHAQTVVFQEDFASGTGQFAPSGSVSTGTYGARLRGGSSPGQITSASINTTGLSNIALSFDRTTSGLDLGEAAVAS